MTRQQGSRLRLWLGVVLVAACVLQWTVGWTPTALHEFQADPWYRALTGIGLAAILGLQWHTGLQRGKGRNTRLVRHRWLGVATPALYLLHSAHLGHAYLAVLSILLIGNNVIGILDPQGRRLKTDWWRRAGLPIHIIASVAVTMLAAIHIWVAASYH